MKCFNCGGDNLEFEYEIDDTGVYRINCLDCGNSWDDNPDGDIANLSEDEDEEYRTEQNRQKKATHYLEQLFIQGKYSKVKSLSIPPD